MKQRPIKIRMWYNDKMYDNPVVVYNCLLRQALHDDPLLRQTEAAPKLPHDYVGNGARFLFFADLVDKNDQEVWEGSVVEAKSWSPMTYVVEFIEGAFCLTNPKLKGSPIDINMMYSSVGCAFEVIGNIHENPELLPQ